MITNSEVLTIINERLSVRMKEKKEFGEVFTPIKLICEILDELPISVWKNPDFKWLDPSNGIGNFPIVVYYKLFNSLTSWEPDDSKRSKHIIENMLYMVEINNENNEQCKKIFTIIDKNSKPNIFCQDFLEEFNINNFDIIMSNPPFSKKVGPNKNHYIWNHFVKKSFTHLKKNGYLLFIHPNGWRSISGRFRDIFNLINERNLISLTMRDYKTGEDAFKGAVTNYDYYCLNNTITDKNITKINDIDKKTYNINLNKYKFIPSGKFKDFDSLVSNNNVNILYSSNAYETRSHHSKNPTSKIKDTIYIYPIINTITKKKGINLIYSSYKDKNIFIPKVVWSNGTATYPIVDEEGKYGLTQFSYGIIDSKENLPLIKKALENPKFLELMKYVKFSKHKYDHKIIGTFKKDFYKNFI